MLGEFSKWLGYISLGVAVFLASYHYNKRFLDWIRFQSLGTRDYIVEKLSLMFIEINPQQILLGQFLLAGGLGMILFLLVLPNFIPAIVLGALGTFLGWKLPKPIVDFLYQRRVNKFVLQMVDALSLMANGMKSGLSISQSLGLVTQELPNPIKQEFNLLLNQNKLGVSLEEAFVNLSKRVVSDEVEMFVTAVNILKETGGNLAETFETIVDTMRERIKVENKIAALTAQGRNQGMVLLAVPPVMFFILRGEDPELMAPLTSTAIGWIILTVVIGLELVAYFAIMRITKIDV